VSVKDWVLIATATVAFTSTAFLVWGLGRTLQSLFD
jgi:hypothetical protein